MEIVGREDELAALHAFLDGAGEEPTAIVLEGEAGIGKSTLWMAGVEAARERGQRVLTARPAEAERGLAHVVLGDLFEEVLDEVLPALPAPRRRALEAALLLDEASEQPVDPRTLGVAVRTALQALAERTPVVLAVDDIQWVDASSASALAFALRRMAADRVLLLLARRLVEGAQPSELERALEAESVQPAADRPPQRRRAPSVPGRPARQDLRAPDVAAHSRGFGRKPVLRVGAGPCSRRRRRPAAAAPRSRDARRARARETRRSPRLHPRGTRARVGVGCTVGVAPGAGRHRSRRARGRPWART